MSGSTSRQTLYQILTRKKIFAEGREEGKEKFKRVLNVFDLTLLGIGATLGCGVYVLAGTVAKTIAGPAVVLSFVLAAIVSSFSGVCYAEFAGRVPRAGSAYIYSYVSVGELIAFVIGWNMLIEHTIGTASVAKAMTNYLDSLLGDPQKTYMKKHFAMHVEFLGEYPDVASLLLIMSIAAIVAWGVRKTSSLNNVFTALNLMTVATVIASGFFFADTSNWSIPRREIPAGIDGGHGGFAPFGWTGIVAGAARCFYAYIGFDSIATTGEETRDPRRTIPTAIVLSLLCVTCAYAGVASVLTLMWPYYDQDPNAPLPVIYDHLGLPLIKYTVTCGAVFALFTTLLGSLFPIPRILYAMSSDGLLFSCLSTVNERTRTPVTATLVCGVGAGLLSTVFDLEQLVDMASIGTLISYMIVCVCVLVLRYRNNRVTARDPDDSEMHPTNKFFTLSNAETPDGITQRASRVFISVFGVFAFVFCICLANIECHGGSYKFPLTVVVCISAGILFISMFMLHRLPQAIENLSFRTPLVPFVPCLSIVLNLYFMMELNIKTWIRFSSWLVIGLFIYGMYGTRHSLEGLKQRPIKDKEDGHKP